MDGEEDEDAIDRMFDAYRRGEIPRVPGYIRDDHIEEDLENTPLFMSRAPQGDVDPEKSPAIAALQSIIDEEQTPEEAAAYFKDGGNEKFRQGGEENMKGAIRMYSDGLYKARDDCRDRSLVLMLYANRAAAHLMLKNHRQTLLDCASAWKEHERIVAEAKTAATATSTSATSSTDDSDSSTAAPSIKTSGAIIKACVRACKASSALGRPQEGVEWCDKALTVDPAHETVREHRALAVKAEAERLKRYRKQQRERSKMLNADKALIEAIESRGIHMRQHPERDTSIPTSILENPSGHRLHLKASESTGELTLCVPVMFLYPEFHQTDFIEEFSEHATFQDHLSVMFAPSEVIAWNTGATVYRADNLEVYFEQDSDMSGGTVARQGSNLCRVNRSRSLLQVLQDPRFCIVGGIAVFFLVAADSQFKESFLKSHRI